MKRLLTLVLCAAMTVSLFAGCGGKKDPGAYTPTGDGLTWDEDYTGPVNTAPVTQIKKMTLTWYPDKGTNPYTCTEFTNQALYSLVYQGLFSVDRDYSIEPVLCKNYSMSEDMKTYTFYPAAATFADGSALTAEDIVASLEAARAGVVYSGRFSHVQQVALSQDGGVTVVMDTPYENLPLLLDVPIVKASDVELPNPMGTGPYALESANGASLLRRRSDWWCHANLPVNTTAITLVTAQSATQIRDTFEFEDLSLVYADPGSDRYADYRCDYELWDCENGVFLYLACNMNSLIFSDPAIRSALTGVIDRERIAADNYRGFARVAYLPASPQSPYYNKTLASRYGYDAGAAFTQAVAAAQLPADTVLKLLVNSDDTLRSRIARDIATALRSCGMTVELLALDSEEYRYYLKMGWYDLYLGQTRLSPNMDLTAFFSSSGALSWGALDSVSLYTLCTEALANHGNFYTLHQNVMDDGRLCPVLFSSYAVYATRGLLTGLTPARDNVFYYSLGRSMESARLE